MPLADSSRVIGKVLWDALNQSLVSQPGNDVVEEVKSALEQQEATQQAICSSCLSSFLGGDEEELPEGVRLAIQNVATTQSGAKKEGEPQAALDMKYEIATTWRKKVDERCTKSSFFAKRSHRVDIEKHVEVEFIKRQAFHEKNEQQLTHTLNRMKDNSPALWEKIQGGISSEENKSGNISVADVLQALMREQKKDLVSLLKICDSARSIGFGDLIKDKIRQRPPHENTRVRACLESLFSKLYKDYGDDMLLRYLPCLKCDRESQLDSQ